MVLWKKMGLTTLWWDMHTTFQSWQGEKEFHGLQGDFPLTIREYSESSCNTTTQSNDDDVFNSLVVTSAK
jgi:hypothetical protein